ncbi:hypothetical protein BDI4_10058 [Burkholderia diffusa]|nr:hypothetical protein BDI4_10058 [Burkholderia diffusa]
MTLVTHFVIATARRAYGTDAV